MDIKKVVVIGSGTMGSGIAAHLCNANIPVTLLDLTTEISKKREIEYLNQNHRYY
jgi:3-hydroxyacyl-CoA dehydrogenase